MTRRFAQWSAVVLVLGVALVAWRLQVVAPPLTLGAVAAPAVWAALLTLAALGCGLPVARLVLGGNDDDLDFWVVALAAGAAALMACAGVLGVVGLFRPVPLLVVFVAAGVGGAWQVVRRRGGLAELVRDARVSFLPAVILVVLGGAALLAAASESVFYDQWHYHLAFPGQWLRGGAIAVFPRHFYSYLPANSGLLYGFALAGVGATGAQATHAWFGALATLAAAAIARRLGGAVAGWWGAVFVASIPSVITMLGWAAADLTVAAFGAAAWLVAVRGWQEAAPARSWAAGALGGVFVGAAVGAKYLAAATVGAPLALVLIVCLVTDARAGRGRASLLTLLAWGAGACAAFAPWMLRNVLATGNPLFPYFGSLFGSQTVAAAVSERIGSTHEGLGSLFNVLTLRTFDPRGAAGWIGPLVLALFPLWVFHAVETRSRDHARLILGFVAGVAGWAMFPQLGRYLLPVLAPALAAMAAAFAALVAATSATVRRASLVIVAFLVLWCMHLGFDSIAVGQMVATVGAGAESRLRNNVTYWPAIDVVNKKLPQKAKLLLVAESRALHLDRDVVVEDPFQSPLLVEIAEASRSAEDIVARLRADGVSYVLFNEAEAARIAALNHRESYFAEASPAARQRLEDFWARCLTTGYHQRPVGILALRPCGEPTPEGRPLARLPDPPALK